MRKPVYAICEQQRRRSACASAQSDQRLWCSLPRSYDTSSFYIRNFKSLPNLYGCAGRFESTLVANPEDRISRDEVQMPQHTRHNPEWGHWSQRSRKNNLHYVMNFLPLLDVVAPRWFGNKTLNPTRHFGTKTFRRHIDQK